MISMSPFGNLTFYVLRYCVTYVLDVAVCEIKADTL